MDQEESEDNKNIIHISKVLEEYMKANFYNGKDIGQKISETIEKIGYGNHYFDCIISISEWKRCIDRMNDLLNLIIHIRKAETRN